MYPEEHKKKGRIIPQKGKCTTVTCKAFKGNPSAIFDLLLPTHGGGRIQGEGSLLIFSGSIGVNALYNRNDDRLIANVDWGIEVGPSIPGLPGGVSITGGPQIGWGSSSIEDITTGSYAMLSGTAAGGTAFSAAATAPLNTEESDFLLVDEVYGQVPVTLFFGMGVGAAYAGVSGGGGSTFDHNNQWVNTDISFLLPWHWK